MTSIRSTADIGKASKYTVESEIRRPLIRIASLPLPEEERPIEAEAVVFQATCGRSQRFLAPDNLISVRSITAKGRVTPAPQRGCGWTPSDFCPAASSCIGTVNIAAKMVKPTTCRRIATASRLQTGKLECLELAPQSWETPLSLNWCSDALERWISTRHNLAFRVQVRDRTPRRRRHPVPPFQALDHGREPLAFGPTRNRPDYPLQLRTKAKSQLSCITDAAKLPPAFTFVTISSAGFMVRKEFGPDGCKMRFPAPLRPPQADGSIPDPEPSPWTAAPRLQTLDGLRTIPPFNLRPACRTRRRQSGRLPPPGRPEGLRPCILGRVAGPGRDDLLHESDRKPRTWRRFRTN